MPTSITNNLKMRMANGRLAAVSSFRLSGCPALRFRLRQRVAAGREEQSRIDERFGHASLRRPKGHLVWVHAASVGETNSVLPLIDDLLETHPKSHVLLTTGTVTSAEIVAAYQNRQTAIRHRLTHQYAPLDRTTWVNPVPGPLASASGVFCRKRNLAEYDYGLCAARAATGDD